MSKTQRTKLRVALDAIAKNQLYVAFMQDCDVPYKNLPYEPKEQEDADHE